MISAFGSCSFHHAISSITFGWSLMSILLITSTTGQSTFWSFAMYSSFLSAFSTVSVTYRMMSASPMAVSTKFIMFFCRR